MPIASTTALNLVDAMASTLGQAMQLARTRLASAASPILRLMIQRDHEIAESELLRRELDILRTGRENMPPQKRPDYQPAQRLAILQIMRLRGWNMNTTARHFVIHENTLRAWIKSVEGNGKPSLLAGAIVWNRMDDAVRWAEQELRRLYPEPEFGTRTMARHLLRAGIQVSRSTVQRVLREAKPTKPPIKPRPAMEEPARVKPYNLLTPKKSNHVWHTDLTQIRVLWFTFVIAAVLDGFSRKLLALKVYARTPCARNMAALVRGTAAKSGKPQFIISDNGSQFRKHFGKAMRRQRIRHVRGRVRSPYLNGKIERFFRTFKCWARLVLFGFSVRNIQWRLDNFMNWYNTQRPHSSLGTRTPEEAFRGNILPKPIQIRARDGPQVQIEIARYGYSRITQKSLRSTARLFNSHLLSAQPCRGPHLPTINIRVRRAA